MLRNLLNHETSREQFEERKQMKFGPLEDKAKQLRFFFKEQKAQSENIPFSSETSKF